VIDNNNLASFLKTLLPVICHKIGVAKLWCSFDILILSQSKDELQQVYLWISSFDGLRMRIVG
jgi:hypothetical protein